MAFPYLQWDAGMLPETIDLWLRDVEGQYRLQSNPKLVNQAQLDEIRNWFNTSFTQEASVVITNRMVRLSGNGYLIMGGILGMVPVGSIQSVQDAKIVRGADLPHDITFTATYILSGSQDAYLTCNLREEGGYLKIDSWKTLYR